MNSTKNPSAANADLCLALRVPLPLHPGSSCSSLSCLTPSSLSNSHSHGCCSLPNCLCSSFGTDAEHTEEEKEAVEQLREWQRIRQLSYSQDEYETDVASSSPSICGPTFKKYGFELQSSLPLHTHTGRAAVPHSCCSDSGSVSSKGVVKGKRKAHRKSVSVTRGNTKLRRPSEGSESEEIEFDERQRKKTRLLTEIYSLRNK